MPLALLDSRGCGADSDDDEKKGLASLADPEEV